MRRCLVKTSRWHGITQSIRKDHGTTFTKPVYAFNCLQGRRGFNEDRVVTGPLDATTYIYGVFDGNGGPEAAEFVSANIIDAVLGEFSSCGGDVGLALAKAIGNLDNTYARLSSLGRFRTGTTATVAVVTKGRIVVAQVGDSRAILVRTRDHVVLTDEHRASNESERVRVTKAGGRITWSGAARVGGLAMTRAIGCYHLRGMGVISTPTITVHNVNADTDAALVIATDGIFDFASNEAIAHIVSSCHTPEQAVQQATNYAFDVNHSKDNLSTIVVALPAWSKLEPQNFSQHIPLM